MRVSRRLSWGLALIALVANVSLAMADVYPPSAICVGSPRMRVNTGGNVYSIYGERLFCALPDERQQPDYASIQVHYDDESPEAGYAGSVSCEVYSFGLEAPQDAWFVSSRRYAGPRPGGETTPVTFTGEGRLAFILKVRRDFPVTTAQCYLPRHVSGTPRASEITSITED